MDHDFYYNANSGVFTAAESDDTLLSDIVLILSTKSVSRNKRSNGTPVYGGDLIGSPSIGNRLYEIKTATSDIELLIKKEVEASLSLLIKNNKVVSVMVAAVKSFDVAGRIDITVDAIATNGVPVTYKQFVEVY